jgi:hypothetical protein
MGSPGGTTMARMQGIIFFAQGQQGWSEVYPLAATTYATAETAINDLVNARLDMLPVADSILGWRISDIDVKGDSKVELIEQQGSYDAAGTPPAEPDVATTVIKIRADTADHLHRGVRYLHGIPDRVVLGGVYNPDAAFSTAMTAYLALLVTSVDIKSRQIVAPGPPPVIVYTFHAIGECVVDGVWSRKVGRPFGLHRGKLRTA